MEELLLSLGSIKLPVNYLATLSGRNQPSTLIIQLPICFTSCQEFVLFQQTWQEFLDRKPNPGDFTEEMERPIPKSCTKKKLFDYNEVYRRTRVERFLARCCLTLAAPDFVKICN